MSFGISDCVNEENQKNKVAVYCPLCGCKILTKEMGTYSNQPVNSLLLSLTKYKNNY